jgi:hypothetical protein
VIIRARRNQSLFIEFLHDKDTDKLYLWEAEQGRYLTNKDIEILLGFINKSLQTVSQKEIKELNEEINQERIKQRYLNRIEWERHYTQHVLSKDYHADLHGHVVCFEKNECIRFDCTKKTVTPTLHELLNHLRKEEIIVHHVFETVEAKKLCAWLDRMFAFDSFYNQSCPSDFREYIVQAIKERRHFPKGILDLIVD